MAEKIQNKKGNVHSEFSIGNTNMQEQVARNTHTHAVIHTLVRTGKTLVQRREASIPQQRESGSERLLRGCDV